MQELKGRFCNSGRVTSVRLMLVSAGGAGVVSAGLESALLAWPDLARPNLAGVRSWKAARAALCSRRCAGVAAGDAKSGTQTKDSFS